MDLGALVTGLKNWRSATTGTAGALALTTISAIVSGQMTWSQSIPFWVGVAVLAVWPEVQGAATYIQHMTAGKVEAEVANVQVVKAEGATAATVVEVAPKP